MYGVLNSRQSDCFDFYSLLSAMCCVYTRIVIGQEYTKPADLPHSVNWGGGGGGGFRLKPHIEVTFK